MSVGTLQAIVTGGEQYRSRVFRRIVILTLLGVAMCMSIALDMALGPANYTLRQVLSAIFDPPARPFNCASSSGISACRSR